MRVSISATLVVTAVAALLSLALTGAAEAKVVLRSPALEWNGTIACRVSNVSDTDLSMRIIMLTDTGAVFAEESQPSLLMARATRTFDCGAACENITLRCVFVGEGPKEDAFRAIILNATHGFEAK